MRVALFLILGDCTISVGEILRWIAGKVIIAATRSDVITSIGTLQVRAEYNAGGEVLVHSMRTKERTEAVLLVDTENVFNVVNKKAFLHNINVICPLIPTLVHKCYSKPLRLFIIGEVKISS